VTAPESSTRTGNGQSHVRQPEEERQVHGNESHPAPGDGGRAAPPAAGATPVKPSNSKNAAEKDRAQAPDDRRDDRNGDHAREPGAHDRGNDKEDKDRQ
jgi:hypothetical protein